MLATQKLGSITGRSTSRTGERAENGARREELGPGGDAAGPVPAVEAMAGKELAPGGAREADDVLDIGDRSRHGAEDGGVERPAPRREEEESRDPARDLEPARVNVVVRHPVAEQMRDRP